MARRYRTIQLWVNLPQSSKLSAPGYQTIVNDQISAVQLDGEAGSLRVIAGSVGGAKGPATTFTPIELYDLRLRGGDVADPERSQCRPADAMGEREIAQKMIDYATERK